MADEKHNLITWLGFTTEPDFSKARWLGHLISVVLIALYLGIALTLIVGLWWTIAQVPKAAYDAFFAEEPQTVRWLLTSTAALTAVTTAVVALPFTVLKTIYNRRQTHVAEQSHLTDQINKAVENLGATRQVGDRLEPNVEVRVGGLLALERIAQTHPAEHIRTIDIICAYLVENSQSFVKSHVEMDENGIPISESPIAARQDLNTVLRILSVRSVDQISMENKRPHRIDLRELDLRGLRIEGISFVECDLTRARFCGAELNVTYFEDSYLKDCNFDFCSLSRVEFSSSPMSYASFISANFYQTSFDAGGSAFFPRLREIKFDGAWFDHMDLPAFVSVDNLHKTIGGPSVKGLPTGAKVPDHWPDPGDFEELVQCVRKWREENGFDRASFTG